MKILHIACGFPYSKVYEKMFEEINLSGVSQDVYIPLHQDIDEESFSSKKYTYRTSFNKIIDKYDKVLYFTKINKMFKFIEKNYKLNKYDLIHAHSLFSDGAVAYELYKKKNIPYIVAVRNTDVNKYFKFAPHLKKYALNILKNAQYIIFLSPLYKKNVFDKYIPKELHNLLLKKTLVIPNGIDSFWLENINHKEKNIHSTNIKLLSVGVIDKNKNALKVAKACELLINKYNYEVTLTLVGKVKDTKYYNKLKKYDFITILEAMPMTDLIEVYKKNDIYTMPSISETFGLVYGEAMTQGLPLIYTKGQGFDQQFEDGSVGYSVDCYDENEIAEKVIDITNNYQVMSTNSINSIGVLSWNNIVKKYMHLYKKVEKQFH